LAASGLRRSSAAVALLAAFHATALGQAPPAFEVASVRPVRTTAEFMATRGSRLDVHSTTFDAVAYPLAALVTLAHAVHGGQLKGMPEWAEKERFTVRARTAQSASRGEMVAMLRVLLEDRFGLQAHRETQETDAYGLVLIRPGRPGPGLHPVQVDCETMALSPGSPPGIFPPDARPACNGSRVEVSTNMRTGERSAMHERKSAMTMETFAQTLWGVFGRPVFDRTGLAGTYDVDWTFADAGVSVNAAAPDGPTRREALREQLGLTVTPDRGSVEFLIVDRLERPLPD
jgi:uncharacterized protein (TIGR03435 family)